MSTKQTISHRDFFHLVNKLISEREAVQAKINSSSQSAVAAEMGLSISTFRRACEIAGITKRIPKEKPKKAFPMDPVIEALVVVVSRMAAGLDADMRELAPFIKK